MDNEELTRLRRLYKADIDGACRVMNDGGVITVTGHFDEVEA